MSYPPPLFILGSPRSFTSIVCAVLGQHPQAYGTPELNLFVEDHVQDLWARLSGRRQFMIHGILRMVAQLYAGEQDVLTIDMARRWLLRRLAHSTADIYHELCEKVTPLCIIDKSPVYPTSLRNLNRIHAAFPDARYLHLVRHPRTQGESVMKLSGGMFAIMADSFDYGTLPPTLDPQVSWYSIQQNISRFLETIPTEHHMRMRGEDFLNNLQYNLAICCEWLGLSVGTSAMEAMRHPEASPYAVEGPFGARLGNDINFLRSPKLRDTQVPEAALDGSMPWRPDGVGLRPEVLELARSFGYQ
jgi:hypothetical protein